MQAPVHEQTAIRSVSSSATTTTMSPDSRVPPVSPDDIPTEKKGDLGDYWLPWHIDSNFVTLIHKEMYAYESDASFAPEPEGAGVVFMNEEGDMTRLDTE